MKSRYTPLAVVAAAAVSLIAAPVFATSSLPIQPSSVLHAGQTLTADVSGVDTTSDSLMSAGGEYHFRVYSERIQLEQRAPLNVNEGTATTTTWSRFNTTPGYHSYNDASTLRMQTDGNLVLRTSGGHVLWASNTAGSGTQNYLFLSAGGDLFMYTSTHREVWSTATSAIYLPSGSSLFSGQGADDRRGEEFPGWVESVLTMRTDGNLVYECGGKALWQTHTYSPGAYLTMQVDGNLVIYSAGTSHTALWQSHTVGHDPFTYLDTAHMKILSAAGFTVWSAPLAPSACS